uniref:CD99 antigen-like protein 2 n=1 Tax=Mus spicilegus TaxID=10103 RepID=A0A8C6GIG6_MUSSI
ILVKPTVFLLCLDHPFDDGRYGDTDGFNLEDALKETSSVKRETFFFPIALDDDDGCQKPGTGGRMGGLDLTEATGYPHKQQNPGVGGLVSSVPFILPCPGISTETGTIAGVASALAMALIGAVSSYISYQQKKFCFSIQQGLNADYVKGENLEAVVCEEPQVTYSKQETQSAEPPPPEPPRI